MTLPPHPLPHEAAVDAVTDFGLLPEAPAARYRIALIEDNVDASDMLSTLLQMLGHKVVTAFDGAAGIELIDKHCPQIVMCDIALPVSDGYDVISKVRAQHGDAMPLMLAVSGQSNVDRVMAAGFDHHLSKPVELETLLNVIASHADRLDRLAQRSAA